MNETIDRSQGIETRNCNRCKGLGIRDYGDEVTHTVNRACRVCKGKRTFTAPNTENIRKALAGRGGRLRSVKPQGQDYETLRAAYVWRMARFHGGKDMTMPICFAMDVEDDPFIPELDKLADAIAVESFGSSSAGAARWGRAMGMI